jgi:hypothetical protein
MKKTVNKSRRYQRNDRLRTTDGHRHREDLARDQRKILVRETRRTNEVVIKSGSRGA